MRCSDCPHTVQFYGALFREGDVWICMEVMDMSLDKFYTKVYKHNRSIPEDILGKIAFAVSKINWYIFIIEKNHVSIFIINLTGSKCTALFVLTIESYS